MRGMRPALIVLAMTMALPCVAQAGTLARTTNGEGEYRYTFTGDAAANDVAASYTTTYFRVTDSLRPITAYPVGCTHEALTAGSRVTCYSEVDVYDIRLETLGGNDEASGSAGGMLDFNFYMGEGNDTVDAGLMGDFIDCGNDPANPNESDQASGNRGADIFHGCEVVDYSDHTTAGVSVTPDGVANDGNATDNNAHDNVYPDGRIFAIIGTDHGDSIHAADGLTSSISDNDGSDQLYGSDSFTDFHMGPGTDYVFGGAGNERINETSAEISGDDVYQGGGGSDTISYYPRPCDVRAWVGVNGNGCAGENDTIHTTIESVFGGFGDDDLRAGAGDGHMRGYLGDDVLAGGAGKDSIAGGDGFDIASYADHAQQVIASIASPPAAGQGGVEDGNTGRDTFSEIEGLEGGGGADTLTGDDGPNVLRGGGGLDQLHGLDGADSFEGGGGQDVYHGGLGVDTADYSARTSPVVATLGGNGGETGENDNLQNGIERLVGGSADDDLRGGQGNNAQILEGGAGNDVLDGGGGGDVMLGGAGTDRVSYATRNTGVVADLDGVADDGDSGIVENDLIGADVEDLVGGGGGDILTGNGEANRIEGGDGEDTIDGLGEVDRLGGGDGSDTITSRDDVADEVFCGVGGDSVIADALDVLAGDCETVQRPAPAPPADGGTPPPPPPTGGSAAPPVVNVVLGVLLRGKPGYDAKRRLVLRGLCPSPAAERCQGVLRIKLGRRTIATARFDVAGGARKTFRLRLSKATLRKLRRARRTKVTAAVIPTGGTAARKTLTLLRP